MKFLFPQYSVGHFINQPANPTEFEITRFDEMEDPDVEDLHKHTFYEIIWIEDGESRQTIDYKDYEIRSGDLFFISPGQLHHFEEWKPVVGGSIMFTADFYLLNHPDKDRLFEFSFLDAADAGACVRPDPKSYEEIKQTIDLLYAEARRPDRSPDICRSLLHILLARIQRSTETEEFPIPKHYVVQYKVFKNLLEEYFPQGLSAGDYARKMNISTNQLNFIVQQVTGKSTSEIIRARSLLEAKRLLTFTDMTVAQVAAKLCFYDPSYFGKLFKADAGVTPQDFKTFSNEKYRKK